MVHTGWGLAGELGVGSSPSWAPPVEAPKSLGDAWSLAAQSVGRWAAGDPEASGEKWGRSCDCDCGGSGCVVGGAVLAFRAQSWAELELELELQLGLQFQLRRIRAARGQWSAARAHNAGRAAHSSLLRAAHSLRREHEPPASACGSRWRPAQQFSHYGATSLAMISGRRAAPSGDEGRRATLCTERRTGSPRHRQPQTHRWGH